MKSLFTISLIIILIISSNIFSQNIKPYSQQKKIVKENLAEKGEVYFRFYTNSKELINKLTAFISIDNVIDKGLYFEVRAYANEKEMNDFAKENIGFEVLKSIENINGIKTSDDIKSIMEWDTYPSYNAYQTMMNSFQTLYPNICKNVNFGNTVQDRELLCVIISDSVNFRKNKPRFFYSSSTHGDELTGYVMMLRLIDTLLKGYGTNPKITYLVKNCEIWINPLANPDGTYHGGNGNVTGAVRYNANNIDLNRNFPDPAEGPYPTGPWQPETIAMMNLATAYNHVLSVTFHGGTELYSYPWGTWSRLPPDDDWYIHIARHYVDTVHSINPSYMIGTGGYPNIPGITNSYAWYRIVGGKKDFIEYFRGGREVSIELSNTKTPPGSTLPNYWNYNFKSFLNYIQECLYGVRGIVTDSVTGLPLKAKIRVIGKEIADSTWVITDSVIGDYHRMIFTGTYTISFSAPNYYTKTVTNVYVKNDSTTTLNIQLRPIPNSVINQNQIPGQFELYQNYPNPFNPVTKIKFDIPEAVKRKTLDVRLIIYDLLGKEITTLVNEPLQPGTYEVTFNGSNLPSGVYFYKLGTGNFKETKKPILLK